MLELCQGSAVCDPNAVFGEPTKHVVCPVYIYFVVGSVTLPQASFDHAEGVVSVFSLSPLRAHAGGCIGFDIVIGRDGPRQRSARKVISRHAYVMGEKLNWKSLTLSGRDI